jgi:hypothetical protein
MGIASTAFAPEGNDITKGGRAFRVNLVRVGRMVPAARDTYRRVYRDDGTYHYPQIATNRLRRKGEHYFKSMEITGSNPGTAKEPKFDLLSFYRDIELPRLDALCAEVAAVTGKAKVVVRYQKDSAGPHTDGALNDFLTADFRRGIGCSNFSHSTRRYAMSKTIAFSLRFQNTSLASKVFRKGAKCSRRMSCGLQ